MNRKEYRAAIRTIADDDESPPLWPDAFLNLRIQEARVQAARRGRLAPSSEDPICRFSLKANRAFLVLDPRIVSVRKVYIDGSDIPIEKIHHEDLDTRFCGWRTQTGNPIGYCMGVEKRKLRWLFTPETNGTGRLLACITPEELPDDDSEEDFFSEAHQFALFDWVLYRMYTKRDVDTYDPHRAADHLAAFEMEFGKAISATEEQWELENYGFVDDGAR